MCQETQTQSVAFNRPGKIQNLQILVFHSKNWVKSNTRLDEEKKTNREVIGKIDLDWTN